MFGYLLLLGHLAGDFLFQTDWQAKYKAARRPSEPRPVPAGVWVTVDESAAAVAWDERVAAAALGPWACAIHCFAYAAAVFLVFFAAFLVTGNLAYALPWWFYAGVGLLHYPLDRYRLAYRLMQWHQRDFAANMAPWSVVVVDNTIHLLVNGFLALLAGAV